MILHLQVELYALDGALMGLLQIRGVDGSSGLVDDVVTSGSGGPMILSAIVEKPKRRSNDDFKGRHFEASLIMQAVSWSLFSDVVAALVAGGMPSDADSTFPI